MAKGKWLFYGLGAIGLVLAATGGGFAYLRANYEPRLLTGYQLGEETLTGSKADVERQINEWFADYAQKKIKLSSPKLKPGSLEVPLSEFGATVDAQAEAAKLRYTDFIGETFGRPTALEDGPVDVQPKIHVGNTVPPSIEEFVKAHHRPIQQAKARLVGDSVKLTYEASDVEFDPMRMADVVRAAIESDWKGEIPLKEAPKSVPDQELRKIKTVIAQFTTSFNAGQIARSANIKLAASTIDGLVLMPGESFSFNDFLGKRTPAKGYHAAGVYVSGRHDIDFGGGICQVSTTLYNASLDSGLKIAARYPHSLPVPYVPLGRDAAVSFPQPNLKVTNPYDYPIALAAIPQKGKLTFAILGPAPSKRTYKYESKLLSTWSNGEKLVHDPSLPYGKRKIVDKGGSGRKVQTWQLVYENGKLIERRNLGVSTYRGGPVIVAVNKKATPPVGNEGANPGDEIPVENIP